MGKHFDTLVDIVKKEDDVDDIKKMIMNAKLFEFPFSSSTVRDMTDMEMGEFVEYFNDYMELSKQNNSQIFFPFKTMAIEDEESVVIVRNNKEGNYDFINCSRGLADTPSITKGEVEVKDRMESSGQLPMNVKIIENIAKYNIPDNDDFYKALAFDGGQAFLSFVKELVYIMDPSRFILSKESNASIKQKQKKSKRNMMLKTVMRPHFIFVEKEDMKRFLSEESKEPFTAHPVAGHWRRLRSERYKNMQNQVITVRQYWKGDGNIIGRNGWNYHAYIKTGNPLRLTKYTPKKNGKLPK